MLKFSGISKKHMIIIVVMILGISGWVYPFISDMEGSGGFEEKNIIIKVSENKVMNGLLYKPEGEGPFPLVYFGPGLVLILFNILIMVNVSQVTDSSPLYTDLRKELLIFQQSYTGRYGMTRTFFSNATSKRI